MGKKLWQLLQKWYNDNPLIKLAVGVITAALITETTVFCLKAAIAVGMYLTSFLPTPPPGPEIIQLPISPDEMIRFIDSILFAMMFAIYFLYEFVLFLLDIGARVACSVAKV
jgi:hypothetical protein